MYKCVKCNYATSRHTDYKRHLTAEKHRLICQSQKKFACDICSKLYAYKLSFENHLLSTNLK